ncbi:putative heterochromatin protein hp1 [Phaeomoniella chlamydospora]|uniref:Putative heterochromatin protein hp1 n=1 Tax=Phaeomoniella chlamydospora TaxID=158046 RepID=A0A0G2GVK4_PHACM|nr:putative heterochromatin protein hp1 [Phaeomoniella chlamydospora]
MATCLVSSSDESDSDSMAEIPAAPPANGKGKGKKEVTPEVASINGAHEEPEEEETVEDVFEIESILEHRVRRNKIELKIKWVGYENEEDQTWEPEENLEESSAGLLAEYYQSIGGRPALPTKKNKQADKPEVERASKRQKRTPEELPKDWVPKGASWDREIAEVSGLERLPDGQLQVLAIFKNGHNTKVTNEIAYQRFPQTMLRYYESKL